MTHWSRCRRNFNRTPQYYNTTLDSVYAIDKVQKNAFGTELGHPGRIPTSLTSRLIDYRSPTYVIAFLPISGEQVYLMFEAMPIFKRSDPALIDYRLQLLKSSKLELFKADYMPCQNISAEICKHV